MPTSKNLVSLALTSCMALGCGDSDDDKEPITRSYTETGSPGVLSVEFENNTVAGLTEGFVTPSYFGLIIVSVELIDSEGNYRAIWVNDACADTEFDYGIEVEMTEAEKLEAAEAIRQEEGLAADQEVNVGTYKSVFYKYHNAEACDTAAITTYVDLARSTPEVNAELNSQGLPIIPGTYTQASLRLCTPDIDTDTFLAHRFQAGAMTEPVSVTGSGCGVTGAAVENFVVEEGQTATIKLSYDLTTFIRTSTYNSEALTSDTDNCVEDIPNNITYCSNVGAGAISPSIVTGE
ncbi:MAG: hypothetical protein HRU19_16170 [Pseudobacteriovorax sp.]|nr:hypothetical protein [Pseudobacteriovorax sp.]